MNIRDPDTRPSDQWSDWLLKRRHGGNPDHEPVVRSLVARIRDRVLDGAGLQPGMVIVDVGAGDGLMTFGAFERVGSSLSAILLDISEPLLMRAEERAVEYGVRDRCTFLKTPAEELDGVIDGCADVVMVRAVLAYVANKEAAVRGFHRILKPGGRLSLSEPINRDEAIKNAAYAELLRTPAAEAISSRVQLLHRCRQAQLPSTPEEIRNGPLTNFTERDLVTLFQNAGFDEIHMELHIDISRQAAVEWNTYIDIAPRPGAPTLREVFASHLDEAERRILEEDLRPVVESGRHKTRDTTAYLIALKSD